jgi:prepilin-type N-terminal cleavage/methylation domain-containing protein
MMKFRPQHFHSQSAFTMVEVAISLAIIGIALLGIVGVLPLGLNTQRDNREKTIINQDATVFIEAIRNGSRGADDLTNYVYAITNYWAEYAANGTISNTNKDGYGGYPSPGSQITKIASPPFFPITNGLRIIGLLSTPEFTDFSFNPTNNLFSGGYSNHVVAYVRSISGPAVEKPPQNNQILQQDSFGYRIFCVNAPVAMDTNVFSLPVNQRIYSDQLAANLHELRLTFEWPQLPNGNLGAARQTYRAKIGGQILQTNSIGQMLYFYQQQSFTSAP